MKRIATIQDISCIGKCSLTVALPVLSAMGVETAIIPTAVLSAHTAFKQFTFFDLTDEIQKISDHWKKEDITLDAIYTGYLGSFRQIALMKHLFSEYPKALVFVDPAMGDNGKLYTGFDRAFAHEMASLCAMADVITPNLTEAAFMLDRPYYESGYSQAYIQKLLEDLCRLGAKQAIITGLSFEKGKIGIMAMEASSGKFYSYFQDKCEAMYHGTGDIFASTVLGAVMNGKSLSEAAAIAVDFVGESIRLTIEDKNGRWYGVNFEEAIPFLLARMGKVSLL